MDQSEMAWNAYGAASLYCGRFVSIYVNCGCLILCSQLLYVFVFRIATQLPLLVSSRIGIFLLVSREWGNEHEWSNPLFIVISATPIPYVQHQQLRMIHDTLWRVVWNRWCQAVEDDSTFSTSTFQVQSGALAATLLEMPSMWRMASSVRAKPMAWGRKPGGGMVGPWVAGSL